MTEEPWYRSWFGEEYLKLYPHRDHEEARDAVALLAKCVHPGSGTPALDLACGAGRHLRALVGAGFRPVGLDLSLPMLREARGLVEGVPLVRGDMRTLPFAPASFPVVASFFTSFGYFETEREDRRVLQEIRRVLARRGHVLMDFLNAEQVRRTLVPRDETNVEGRLVVQERALREGGRVVEKRIRIRERDGRPVRSYLERVRLYGPEELEALLHAEGLRVVDRFGDYEGRPFTRQAPRVILLARAAAPRAAVGRVTGEHRSTGRTVPATDPDSAVDDGAARAR